jgi:hypothetical protein
MCSEFDDPGREERVGWFRVNFNYFIDVAVVDYVVDAVHLIANEGVKLLAPYKFDPFTRLWHHRDARSAHRSASPTRAARWSSVPNARRHRAGAGRAAGSRPAGLF